MYSGPFVPQPASVPQAINIQTKLIIKIPIFFDIVTSASFLSKCYFITNVTLRITMRLLIVIEVRLVLSLSIAVHSAKLPDYRIVLDSAIKALA